MRKAGIIMSIVGAAAFATLLAWGLTFGSGAVQADDPTATPTATPDEAAATPTATPDEAAATPTATPDEAAATATPGQFCAPQIPGTYHGAVTIDGTPAPAGTTITVQVGGVTFGQTTVTEAGQYVVNVPEPMPSEPPCFTPGTLMFTCDSAVATETPTFSAALQPQDLTCVSAEVVPTPTPEATATPEVTATPTATATPEEATATPTPEKPGLGGASTSGDGFMWWPLAMVAAALTSVAGLFTARWARR
jgi:hypothetical protein